MGKGCHSNNEREGLKFSTGWEVGVVKSVEKKKSVVDQFAVKYIIIIYKHSYVHFTNSAGWDLKLTV